MSKSVVHMIGNAHIDPVWLWTASEGCEAVRATFRSALERMEESPQFIFTAASAAHYDWVERIEPETFERIRRRVAEGRWRIVGGMWVEPDCNIPSGEAMVRQCLLGQTYFQSRFGRLARCGMNVDSFGHAGGLPQILLAAGMDRYVFMRPSFEAKEMDRPHFAFRWRSPDSSAVTVWRIAEAYCSRDEDQVEMIKRQIRLFPGLPAVMCFYGVGDHGGGPTQAHLAAICKAQADDAFPARVLFSHPDACFDDLAEVKDLPEVQGDFQHHARGCYTADGRIKFLNRRCENELLSAEIFSTIASLLLGQTYPAEQLTDAWRTLCFNQFHDILGGTCTPEAASQAVEALGSVRHNTETLTDLACQRIAAQLDTSNDASDQSIVVFNPLSQPRKEVLEIPIFNYRSHFGPLSPENMKIFDSAGEELPFQVGGTSPWEKIFGPSRFCLPVDLPAMGYRQYRITIGRPSAADGKTDLRCRDGAIENARFLAEFDPGAGFVALNDKSAGVQVIDSPAGRGLVIDDPSDTWGHGVERFDKIIAEMRVKSVRLIESGPVRAVYRVVSSYGRCTLQQDYILNADADWLDIALRIDWHATQKMLKWALPTPLAGKPVTCETAYGTMTWPPDGEEHPAQRWVDLAGTIGGKPYGLGIANDGKYGFDVTQTPAGAELRISLLRSCAPAHHDPEKLKKARPYPWLDQGEQIVRLRIVPHAGRWGQSALPARAAALNAPLRGMMESAHPGRPPKANSFFRCRPDSVVITALKPAEDGDGIIIRLYETSGEKNFARIEPGIGDHAFDAEFAPHQLRSFRICGLPDTCRAEPVDLLERPV